MAYVSNEIRRLVEQRALQICEYCLAYQGYSYIKFQIEHIISLKHGGLSIPENLALSCLNCNVNKGSDIGTVVEYDNFTRFYNPRKDHWLQHFEISENGLILSRTYIGEATAKILNFNSIEQVIERREFIETGNYPHINAIQLLSNPPS